MVTAEFTHGSTIHLLFNSAAILGLGHQLESLYGTYFYAALNAWLMILSQALSLLFRYIMLEWVPRAMGGHKYDKMMVCSVGYSNILFGLLTIGALHGSGYTSFYGIQLPKAALPFVLLIMSYLMFPGSDILGHTTGIIAAVVIKFSGFYSCGVLPSLNAIKAAEAFYKIEGSFQASKDAIETDFKPSIWSYFAEKLSCLNRPSHPEMIFESRQSTASMSDLEMQSMHI